MEDPRRVYELVDGHPVLTREEWHLEGQRHRADGPAFRVWEIVNGVAVLVLESWWLEGIRHRVDGPAFRVWEIVDGVAVLTVEHWILEGKWNRLDGPADQWRIIAREYRYRWYLHGKRVDPVNLDWAAVVIQRWFLRHRHRREIIISSLLQADGLTVFPGLMQLLRHY